MTAIYTIRFPFREPFWQILNFSKLIFYSFAFFKGQFSQTHTHNSNTPQSFALARNCPLPVPRWNVLDGTHFPWHDVVIISNLPSSISLSGHETPVTAAVKFQGSDPQSKQALLLCCFSSSSCCCSSQTQVIPLSLLLLLSSSR